MAFEKFGGAHSETKAPRFRFIVRLDGNGEPSLGEASMTSVSILATPEARAALLRAVDEHGPLMFHTTGGRVGGRSYPICLPAEALRLGARDHLLGEVEGIPIYEMEDREGGVTCRSRSYVLDVAAGPAIGFSIAAAPGKRFTLFPVADTVCDHDADKT